MHTLPREKFVSFISGLQLLGREKTLLKLNSNDIGLQLFGSVSSSVLNMGMIFDILSLAGYVPSDIDELKIQAAKT